MGLPIIGLAVRLVGQGVGLTAEAIEARKKHKERSTSYNEQASASKEAVSQSKSSEGSPSQTSGVTRTDTAPPPYAAESVELSPHEAERLIANGQAEPLAARVIDGDKNSTPYDDDTESLSEDEETWAMDEANAAVAEPDQEADTPVASTKEKYGADAQPTIQSMTTTILTKCPPPPTTIPKLPLPVILPQRRPGNKQRGFVYAYAPALSANGIDEATFLSFIKTFHRATHASPILSVVFVSAAMAGFVPEVAAQITSTAIKLAAGAAMELQRRQRTNSFLDEVNERLFKPRGIYAMVMSFKPEQKRPIDAVSLDVESLILKREQSNSGTFIGALKVGAGTTYGDIELPESTPLQFPDLDKAVASGDTEKSAKLKTAGKCLADYYDRRAQALYAARSPDSALAPSEERKPKFASKYSDPNNAVHNGSLVTLLTGGKVVLGQRKAERRETRREARAERKGSRRGYTVQDESGASSSRQAQVPLLQRRGGKKGRRMMKKGVLYLMIVNMPTTEELSNVRATMEREHDEA